MTTYSSGNVKDPAKYGVGIHGTNPNGFDQTVITSAGGRKIELQAWPGDKTWLTAVTSAASGSISGLEGLIGRPIAGSGPIIIREVARDELGDAYVGQYNKDTQLASISEDHEQADLVAHGLAHAWFNGAMFDSIWLSEGHAEWAARSVGEDLDAVRRAGNEARSGQLAVRRTAFDHRSA